MARPRAQEQGVRTTDSFRGGADVSAWAGIDKQNDPGAIPDNSFQVLINIRNRGAKLVDRPGLTKIHTTALEGVVRGIFDPILHGASGGDPELQNVGPIESCVQTTGYGSSGSKLYWLGISACYGPVLYSYASDQSPLIQWMPLPLYQDGVNSGAYVRAIMSDGDRLWCSTGFSDNSTAVSSHFLQFLPPRNLGAPPSTLVGFFGSDNGTPSTSSPKSAQSGQAEFNQKHFWSSAALDVALGSDINVWSWDGLTNTLEDTIVVSDTGGQFFPGLPPLGVTIGVLHEELVLSVCSPDPQGSSAGSKFRKRTLAGAWSTLSLPAGVTSFVGSNYDPAVLGGKIYFFGNAIVTAEDPANPVATVLSYDGTGLALAHNQAMYTGGSPFSLYGLRSPVTFGGAIYYINSPVSNPTKGYIGRFDGSTWNDTFKDLAAQFGQTNDGRLIYWIRVYQGNLYAALIDVDADQHLVRSPGENVGGTWVDVFEATHLGASQAMFTVPSLFNGFESAVL